MFQNIYLLITGANAASKPKIGGVINKSSSQSINDEILTEVQEKDNFIKLTCNSASSFLTGSSVTGVITAADIC